MSINAPYKSAADLPNIIPIFPLAGVLLLPRGELPLNVFEPRYLAMVDDALRGQRLIGMIQPNADAGGSRNVPELFSVGCVGRITQFAESGDGRYIVTLTGVARFRVLRRDAGRDALSSVPSRFRGVSPRISRRVRPRTKWIVQPCCRPWTNSRNPTG